jgi:hypothetical protein
MPVALDIQAVRRQAQEIVDRVNADPLFGLRLQEDPGGALLAFGFSERSVPEFGDLGFPPEVVGWGGSSCVDLTCWSSNCPGTCFVSIKLN